MSYSGGEEGGQEDVRVPEDMEDLIRQSRTALKIGERAVTEVTDTAQAPLLRLVDRVIITGLRKGATDVHIGPDIKGTRVRYRIDGRLQHGMFLPREILPAVVSRIKIMGSMNIAESRIPQDGGAEFSWNGRILDLRISTFPVAGGENVVIRILDKSRLVTGLENLGFFKDDVEIINKSLNMPYGMILVTGPTGSGKTTTLYSALSIINSVYRNIFTIEDPIEYQLPLIRQSQVNIKAGLTFSTGLRSILRQDPDVVLVGEMRDTETAELAIRAALTGHLVFSTLHTNDAASSLPRLIDMGIEPFLITSTIEMVISQRLVRILCNKCKEQYIPSVELLERIGMKVADNPVFYRAKGCPECNESGYRDRTVIYETLRMNPDIRELVLKKAGSEEILEIAKKTGMESMFEKGLKKVAAGITSLEEVVSAARVVI